MNSKKSAMMAPVGLVSSFHSRFWFERFELEMTDYNQWNEPHNTDAGY
jgi:hypothetical protein